MTEPRIIELAQSTCSLKTRNKLLVIKKEDDEEFTVPLREVGVVVASHPYILYTQPVLSGLAENGGVLVVCDTKHHPSAMLLPIVQHSTQTERFIAQSEAKLPLRKRCWQRIVKAKIHAQARLLDELYGEDRGLRSLAATVRSGDPKNVESTASQRYWPALFDDRSFRRRREAPDQNRMLNYGYAVVRAAIARSICASGLHPSLGVHHHNRYNPFCLADDLMEPFRPLVDRVVVELVQEKGTGCEMSQEVRARLLKILSDRYEVEGESRTLFDLFKRITSSLAQVYLGQREALYLPELG